MSQSTLTSAQAMALSQLYTNEITQPNLLEALASTPREQFVPKHLAGVSYVDEELYLGDGRYIPAPLDCARLLAAAEIQPTDRVLIVPCGMGYTSIVAAKIAREVTAVDSSAMFIQHMLEKAAEMGIQNLKGYAVESLTSGYIASAPYDVVVINGAADVVPHALSEQINEGGRLVYIQTKTEAKPGVSGLGELTTLTRLGMQLQKKTGMECFVPLIDAFQAPPVFRFG